MPDNPIRRAAEALGQVDCLCASIESIEAIIRRAFEEAGIVLVVGGDGIRRAADALYDGLAGVTEIYGDPKPREPWVSDAERILRRKLGEPADAGEKRPTEDELRAMVYREWGDIPWQHNDGVCFRLDRICDALIKLFGPLPAPGQHSTHERGESNA